LLSTVALVNAASLRIPLAPLIVLLSWLNSLLFRYATLLVNLSSLLLRPELILIPLVLRPTLLIGDTLLL
jgi:hypothetical protein